MYRKIGLSNMFQKKWGRKCHSLVGMMILFVVLLSTFSASSLPMQAQEQKKIPQPLPAIDVRFEKLPSMFRAQNVVASQHAAMKELKIRIPDLRVDWNILTGKVKMLRSLRQFLTPPSKMEPRSIALNFIKNNSRLFNLKDKDLKNLEVTRDYATKRNGIRRLIFQQQHNGIYVLGSEARVNLTSRGEIINCSGDIIAAVSSAIKIDSPGISAKEAITIAAKSIGATIRSPLKLISGPVGTMWKSIYDRGKDFADDVRIQLYYWAINGTDVRLIWQVFLGAIRSDYIYQVHIDALNGKVLYRATITQSDAVPRWRVFTSDSPAPMSPGTATPDGSQPPVVLRELIETNGDPTASPIGWIPDGTFNTTGNNADAFTFTYDEDDNLIFIRPEAESSDNRDFDFPLDLSAEPDTTTNQNSAIVNVFYWANWYHDRLYHLGFTEAAGNFQEDNFGLGGLGGDAIKISVQCGTNDSVFITYPDGGLGVWGVYTFTGPEPDRDAAFDQEIGIHELTHGLTNRLVGGPTSAIPEGEQSWGLGEGWSDFYALSLLSESGDDLNGNYAVGTYSTYNLIRNPPDWDDNYYFGVRRYPYSRNMSTSPLTFADIDPAQFDVDSAIPINPWKEGSAADQIHNVGEIWCLALWECRANLIDYYGFNEGNEKMLRLVTDSLSLITTNAPTFVEARDAIFSADLAAYGGVNHCLLWAGFSKRGLGPGASAPAYNTTSGVVESFHDAPADPLVRDPVDIILVLDVSGSMTNIAPFGTEPKIEVLWDAVEMFINSWMPFAIPGDRVGVVFFESGITQYPDTSPILLPLCQSAKEVVETIRAEAAGGWTAMGGGILTAKNGFDTDSGNDRFMILFTDGMQNYSPMVVGSYPDHEIQTLPVDPDGDPPVEGDSGVPGEPGVRIGDYGAGIHIIGVGVPSAYQNLLEDIADETGSLFYFTSEPDELLRDFYEMNLVTALSLNSVERVDHLRGEYRKEMGDVSLNFDMNRSVERAVFILSWRGEKRADAMTFILKNPDGIEIDLTSNTKNGDFFKIVTLGVPLMQNNSVIQHEGQWEMIIRGDLDSTYYDASLLVEEPDLKMDFSIAKRDYGTGDTIPITVQMKEGAKVIKNLEKVQVQITRPAFGLGTLLAEYSVAKERLTGNFGVDPDNFPTLVEKKLHVLLRNPKFSEVMKKSLIDNVTLYDDGTHGDVTPGDGTYSADYTKTMRPGVYDFKFEATGSAPSVGPFFRSEILTAGVRVKVPDVEKSEVNATVIYEQPNSYRITVTPFDRFDNLLGPGYVGEVQVTVSGGSLGKVEDGLDGTYSAKLKLATGQSPGSVIVEVIVLGKKIREASLQKLLVPRKRLGLSAHIGLTMPHGHLNTSFDPGLALTADFEYRLTHRLALEGLVGWHHFNDNSSGDFSFVNLSANLKYYFTTARLAPFANGGGGVYFPNTGKTSLGLNAGCGLSFRLSSSLYLESSYNFHHVFTEVKDTEYSTTQLGLKYRF